MKCEPNRLEIFITRLAFLLYGKPVYQVFAERLPISGRELVLDFGCGMGTVAYYVAKKLTCGHLTCLDVSGRWLNICRKTLKNFRNITFIQGESRLIANESFDIVYCHFVLHDIPDSELEKVITSLAGATKQSGVLVFREPLNNTKKISVIKHLMEQNRLLLKDSRIIDVPVMGNALESLYVKIEEDIQ